jgi:ribosomal protein S18 acetylase RimI-like enzyme
MARDIRRLEPPDWEAAAELLAARHRHERRSQPDLPERFEQTGEALILIAELMQSPATDGVIAWDDGEPAGFLAGSMRTPSPLSMVAKFVRSRAAAVSHWGHAIADPDDGELYREMYAALAPCWIERGYFSHYIDCSALDFTVSDAFMSLGFGRQTTLAARRVADRVDAQPSLDIEIMRAGPSDLETVMLFVEAIAQQHASAPAFLPYLREPDASVEESNRDFLNDWGNAYLLARRNGNAVGMFSLHQSNYIPQTVLPERAIYLEDGAVLPGERRSGVGRALLRDAMTWAGDSGYSACLLHFLSANIPASRFWQGNGFWPLVHTLVRHVDERIAWAHT